MKRAMIFFAVWLCVASFASGVVLADVPLGENSRLADAFLNVPWGAGLEQLDQVMISQGFSGKTVLNQGNAVRYGGTYNGYPAYVVLSLWNDQFYEGTASGICQVRDATRNGKIRECFSRLEALFMERYGPPTRKTGGEESKGYYWTKLSGPAGQKDELDLMLAEHFPEGGLTEGSVQVRFINRRLQTCLYAQKAGRTPPQTCPVN